MLGVGGERSLSMAGQRGQALIMVLCLLALVASVVADFQYSSRVDLQLSYNARDELQAEYNALSALRLRALLLKQSRKVQNVAQMLMGAMGGGMQPPPIGQILEMIPVECGLMSAITKKSGESLADEASFGSHKAKGAAGKDSFEEGDKNDFFVGDCMATSESEHAKIAINLLRSTIQNRGPLVAQLLLGLLADPKLHKLFEEDDRNGQHAETPLALVQAITDWIDADHTEQGNLGDEDRHYQYIKDPYSAKNAPFDSVAELQLVYGVSDDLYELMKDNVTIYNDDPGIDLTTAPLERILYWGMPAALRDGVPPGALIPFLPMLGARLRVMRSLASMIPLSVQVLNGMVQELGMNNVVDSRKLGLVFTDRSSTTWYTINAQGTVNNATRHIKTVFQASEGQFYYARVE